MTPLLEARNLGKTYHRGGFVSFRPAAPLRAVDDVSFEIAAGEALGLIGESGCGKTTVGRLVSAATEPTAGQVMLEGEPFANPMALARRAAVQVVFQDTLGALNPRLSIGRQLAEPLVIHGVADEAGRTARVRQALDEVGLSAEVMERFPHEVSGGQRQRIVLARCLTLDPRLLVCDEAVSALDVSVQAHVVNLLSDLKARHGLATLFISHDLRVVNHLCERVGVMYLGRLVEIGPRNRVLHAPMHPYSRALVASLPADRPGAGHRPRRLTGEPPSPLKPPSGCGFHPRCAFATADCRQTRPEMRTLETGRSVACHRAEEIAA